MLCFLFECGIYIAVEYTITYLYYINLNLFKKRAEDLYKTYIKQNYYVPTEEVFYYKNNKVVSKTSIVELLITNNCSTFDYDFVTYEIINDSGETKRRIFDNVNDILAELSEKYRIECVPSKVHILSALLVITRNKTDELYDVTPRGLGVELQTNKLYSQSFINYFFNINPTSNYSIKIIDSNINEIELVNTPQQRQVVCIKDDSLEVVTNVTDILDNDAPRNFINNLKNKIYCYLLRVKE